MQALRSLVVSGLLAAVAAAQGPIVVPATGSLAESLVRAGAVIARADSFVVLADTPANLSLVTAKGLAHQVLPAVPAGEQLYLVPAVAGARLDAVARVLYHTGKAALVSATAAQLDGLVELTDANGLCGVVRVLGDALKLPPEPQAGPDAGLDNPVIVPHPDIQALVGQVSAPNLQNTVTALSSMFTRRSDTAGGIQAQNDVLARFQAIPGLTVSLHDFDANADNVIAELPGVVDPSKIVVIGAHYDSYAGGTTANAPGADDNASGTAAVLEIARLLAQLPLKYTVRFCAFASEEFGLYGSAAYAQQCVTNGDDIIAMVNQDMIAYRAPGEPLDLCMVTSNTSAALNAFMVDVGAAYVPTLVLTSGALGGGSSDHASFNSRGFAATWPFEDLPNYSPYIHSANDVVGTSANDFTLAALSTQLCLAAVAELAVPASMDIQHAPLGNSADPFGPFQVRATVSSLVGSTIGSVQVLGTDANGPFAIAMVPTGQPGEWIADLPGQPVGTTVSYAIEASDTQGRVGRYPEPDPQGGAAVSFEVGTPAAFWFDDFESGANGWTHGMIATQDDWQQGAPQGLSTDPSSAWSGTAVWANDLGGSGWNGAYQNNVNNWLRSPAIDCTGRAGVHLRLRRWLGVEEGIYDQATILVNGQPVWTNPLNGDLIDTSWVPMDLDISAIADNNPSVQIEFTLQSDGGVVYGGWNIDDVALTEPSPAPSRALVADRTFLPQGASPAVALTLDLGAAYANRDYVMLPGISGSSPGTSLLGVHVPLNIDVISQAVFVYHLNTPSFMGFAGVLDGSGRAGASMSIPLGTPPLTGITVTVAAFTVAPIDLATNAVDVLIVP